ncbi:MAG: ADP-forming succinate--CoA ligase subunit beta [Clostridiales bacterium]|nr:ADP-forming succinate--CoA ligase subunit beta [Clostridiales bacterium]
MNIHEYQAMQWLQDYGIRTLPGFACQTITEVDSACRKLGSGPYILKAQVHTGGRGKAGGVLFATNDVEAVAAARKLLGSRLVTAQTGSSGLVIQRVYVRRAVDINTEYYLGFVVDTQNCCITLLASAAGGVEIEQVAAHNPEKIHQIMIDESIGLRPYQSRQLALRLGIHKDQVNAFIDLTQKLYRLFIEQDCMLLEINPLTDGADSGFIPLDAKIRIDDNALFRHADIFQTDSHTDDVDTMERSAEQLGLSYVALDGNIGCMVNGAGLAMATLDLLSQYGGKPANFLDVGGGVSQEKVAAAFRLLISDRRVTCILINIFGGIVQCDLIARGIIEASREVTVKVPIVVRLEGTHAAEGRKLLDQSGLDFTTADDLVMMAQQAVQQAVEVTA